MLNIQTGTPLTMDESKTTLTEIFIQLGTNKPNILPIKTYIERDKDCFIGIGGINGIHDKKHVIPTFNHVAITALQCEFTTLLKSKSIGFIELSPEHQKALRQFHSDNIAKDDLKYIASYATLMIGTVGSRVTNRDMSYEIHIEHLPTDMILDAIRGIVRIENDSKLNRSRSFGYDLTCRNEVEQFMTALGMADQYLNAVIHVEAYQERNGLKEAYDGERIADKSKTYVYKLPLAA